MSGIFLTLPDDTLYPTATAECGAGTAVYSIALVPMQEPVPSRLPAGWIGFRPESATKRKFKQAQRLPGPQSGFCGAGADGARPMLPRPLADARGRQAPGRLVLNVG